MTGYGRNAVQLKGKTITCAIKALNAKSLNLRMHLPDEYRPYEMKLRPLIKDQLERGRINVTITINYTEEIPSQINKKLAQRYYNQLYQLAEELDASHDDLFRLTLEMPEVVVTPETEVKEEERKKLQNLLQQTMDEVINFRQEEGKTIASALKDHISVISDNLKKVKKRAPQRKKSKEKQLKKDLTKVLQEEEIDPTRLEEEMVYYADKIDITEECNRLEAHIEHFTNTMQQKGRLGRKLDFIAQEMLREINTMGAKANDAPIQQAVVQMKDELEKVREQARNVL